VIPGQGHFRTTVAQRTARDVLELLYEMLRAQRQDDRELASSLLFSCSQGIESALPARLDRSNTDIGPRQWPWLENSV
jgi:hypothetical protein